GRRRHTRFSRDWSSDVCSSDLRVLDPDNAPIPTQDGYICISANTDAQAHALFDAIGRPELKTDPRYATVSARFQNVREYFQIRQIGRASCRETRESAGVPRTTN